MRSRKVPSFFQRIIIDFYEHMWSTPNKEADVFADLPDSLRSRLMIVMNRDLIDRIPVLQFMPADVYIRMVQRLRHATFLPGEFVARQGEDSKLLYFIKRGRVDAILPGGSNNNVFMTMRPGDFFGQHGVIYSTKRNCHYRAVDFLDVLVMTRADLQELQVTSPAFAKELVRVDAMRQRKRLELELQQVRDDEKLRRATGGGGGFGFGGGGGASGGKGGNGNGSRVSTLAVRRLKPKELSSRSRHLTRII